jgi:tagatose-1,6-bisphosphate aldolase non-catalytic subunit AgaZ/GatZ
MNEAKVKKKRNKMTMRQRYDVMTCVKEEYVKTGATDNGFAKIVSQRFGLKVGPSTIKAYREAFGIAPVKAATVAEMKQRIAELEAKLSAAGVA